MPHDKTDLERQLIAAELHRQIAELNLAHAEAEIATLSSKLRYRRPSDCRLYDADLLDEAASVCVNSGMDGLRFAVNKANTLPEEPEDSTGADFWREVAVLIADAFKLHEELDKLIHA